MGRVSGGQSTVTIVVVVPRCVMHPRRSDWVNEIVTVVLGKKKKIGAVLFKLRLLGDDDSRNVLYSRLACRELYWL